MKPIVHGLELEYGSKIDFVYIDREAAEIQVIVKQYKVRSQPVFILLDANNTIVKRFDGPAPEADLAAALAELIQ